MTDSANKGGMVAHNGVAGASASARAKVLAVVPFGYVISNSVLDYILSLHCRESLAFFTI